AGSEDHPTPARPLPNSAVRRSARREIDLAWGDHQDDPALRPDRPTVVGAHVSARQLVDVISGRLPGDRLADRAADLGPVPRIVGRKDGHRFTRIPGPG